MLRKTVLALGLGTALASAGAQAQPQTPPPPTGGIRIQVNDHRAVQGDGGASQANVTNLRSRTTQNVTVSAGGRADVTGLEDGVYLVTIAPGDRTGTTYVRIEGGKVAAAEFGARGLPSAATFSTSPADLAAAARAAAEKCDRAAYDAAVAELDRDHAMLEVNLRDINRIIDDYSRLTNLPPDLERAQAVYDSIVGSLFSGRRGPTGTALRGGAPIEPGLAHLPDYLAALREKARLEGRLNQVRAARQQVPPFPEKCGIDRDRLLQVAAVQFLLAPELAVVFANRPQFSAFRLELGGVISKLGAFKPDDTDTGARIGISGGLRWDAPWLGAGQKIGLEARLWYVDYDMKDEGEVVPEPGGTIGLFSPATPGNPFGGYFTGQPLVNGLYEARVQSYGGEVQAQTWLQAGDVRFMPSVGLRLGRTTVDERLSFDIGTPASTSFEQRNDITDTYFGPTVGLKARVDFGGGFYGFGEGSLALEYHRGRGDWRTFVPAVDLDGPRKDKLSSSKWGVSAGAKAGFGVEVGGFTAQFAAGMTYTNASPYLDYKEADSTTTGTGGADIGYSSQKDYFGEARFSVRF